MPNAELRPNAMDNIPNVGYVILCEMEIMTSQWWLYT